MQIKTMAILGAGAVGSYFLWGLHAQMGDNLMIIGRRTTPASFSGRDHDQ